MGSCSNKLKIYVLFIILLTGLLIPSILWSSGFQEEKLFDSDFYSTEELRVKIENLNKQILVLDSDIKALESDIDWLVLKINSIQDSGRIADSKLKESIADKEKKISTLYKQKNRLEYLVQHYSGKRNTETQKNLEEILNKKVSAAQKHSKIAVESIAPRKATPTQKSGSVFPRIAGKQGEYNGISQPELQTAVNKAGLSDWVEIIGTGTCLKIETTLPILFPTGSAKVANEYKSFFKKLAVFLKPYDVKVQVNGYADTTPIKNKKYPSNFELGATRAANIVHELVNYGLKPSIFSVESTGKYRFAAKGMSNQKALERRAEVTVIFSG